MRSVELDGETSTYLSPGGAADFDSWAPELVEVAAIDPPMLQSSGRGKSLPRRPRLPVKGRFLLASKRVASDLILIFGVGN